MPLAPHDRRFNRWLAPLRIEVEHALGMHANSWQLFTKKSVMKLNYSPVAANYLVAVLLAVLLAVLMVNIMCCLGDNPTSKRLGVAPPSVAEYLSEYEELWASDVEEASVRHTNQAVFLILS